MGMIILVRAINEDLGMDGNWWCNELLEK